MKPLRKRILTHRHRPIDIVLLGKTSAGKSASGNMILGREEFSTKSIKNQTPVVQDGSVFIDGETLTVYDTPGIFDAETTNEDVMKQWELLLHSVSSVSTVFLLVMKIDRFTPEEKRTVELIEEFLGDQRLQNTWILFTRGDELESESLTIEKCISETEELERVVQRFNNRYHVFNNIKHNPDQVRRLIKKIKGNQSKPGLTRTVSTKTLGPRVARVPPFAQDPGTPRQPLVSTKTLSTRVARFRPFAQNPDLCVGFRMEKMPTLIHLLQEPETSLKTMGSNTLSSHWLSKRHRNLLKNPKAEDQFSGWNIIMNGGDKWTVEELNKPHPDSTVKKYFVTSFRMCLKEQLIDLEEEGYSSELLDEIQPDIAISDWYASRFDCDSEYHISVELLNHKKDHIQAFKQGPIFAPKSDNKWKQMTHVFKDYGPGVRYVRFTHGGKDRQFWAGWYGIRVTNSSVEIH